jgi:hypothetical protein
MAWIVCDEPISGPFNYPNGLPQITLAELTDWFQETASYIKSIDPSHLVTVWAQPAIQEFFGWTLDYLQALGIPEFDFMYTEDADLTIVPGLPLGYNCSDQTPQYMLDQFLPGKPVVFHPAFTSGCWDTNIICDSDFTVQSTHLNLAIPEYFAVGGNAVLIQNWGTDLYSSVPGWAQCRTYTDSYPKIVAVARTHSALVNPDGHPLAPLGFVRVIYGLNAAKSGSGSGTITSNPTGISCGSDCSEAFSQGSLITLTAQADADSIFTSWSGGGCSGTGTCSVTMNADITVTATFILANVPPEISPKEGTIGTELTIGGSGFGTKKGKLLINGIAAKIAKDGWAPNQIISTISTIPLPVDVAHPVSVVVNKVSILLDGTFTVRMPVLDELLVSTGIPGIPITVTGKFFGTKKGKVYLEDPASGKKKRCKVTYWYMNPANGNSTLTFEVPKLPKGLSTGVAYPLKVANKVGTVQTTFTVKPTPP